MLTLTSNSVIITVVSEEPYGKQCKLRSDFPDQDPPYLSFPHQCVDKIVEQKIRLMKFWDTYWLKCTV